MNRDWKRANASARTTGGLVLFWHSKGVNYFISYYHSADRAAIVRKVFVQLTTSVWTRSVQSKNLIVLQYFINCKFEKSIKRPRIFRILRKLKFISSILTIYFLQHDQYHHY